MRIEALTQRKQSNKGASIPNGKASQKKERLIINIHRVHLLTYLFICASTVLYNESNLQCLCCSHQQKEADNNKRNKEVGL